MGETEALTGPMTAIERLSTLTPMLIIKMRLGDILAGKPHCNSNSWRSKFRSNSRDQTIAGKLEIEATMARQETLVDAAACRRIIMAKHDNDNNNNSNNNSNGIDHSTKETIHGHLHLHLVKEMADIWRRTCLMKLPWKKRAFISSRRQRRRRR